MKTLKKSFKILYFTNIRMQAYFESWVYIDWKLIKMQNLLFLSSIIKFSKTLYD